MSYDRIILLAFHSYTSETLSILQYMEAPTTTDCFSTDASNALPESLSYHSKVPLSRCQKYQQFLFSDSGGRTVQAQGSVRVRLLVRALFLAHSGLLCHQGLERGRKTCGCPYQSNNITLEPPSPD